MSFHYLLSSSSFGGPSEAGLGALSDGNVIINHVIYVSALTVQSRSHDWSHSDTADSEDLPLRCSNSTQLMMTLSSPFRCCECSASLSRWYYEKDGRLFCKNDYWAKFGELCHGCNDPITTGLIMVNRSSIRFLVPHMLHIQSMKEVEQPCWCCSIIEYTIASKELVCLGVTRLKEETFVLHSCLKKNQLMSAR